jgi:hypothetical protein
MKGAAARGQDPDSDARAVWTLRASAKKRGDDLVDSVEKK